jgi:hypothetical protein
MNAIRPSHAFTMAERSRVVLVANGAERLSPRLAE